MASAIEVMAALDIMSASAVINLRSGAKPIAWGPSPRFLIQLCDKHYVLHKIHAVNKGGKGQKDTAKTYDKSGEGDNHCEHDQLVGVNYMTEPYVLAELCAPVEHDVNEEPYVSKENYAPSEHDMHEENGTSLKKNHTLRGGMLQQIYEGDGDQWDWQWNNGQGDDQDDRPPDWAINQDEYDPDEESSPQYDPLPEPEQPMEEEPMQDPTEQPLDWATAPSELQHPTVVRVVVSESVRSDIREIIFKAGEVTCVNSLKARLVDILVLERERIMICPLDNQAVTLKEWEVVRPGLMVYDSLVFANPIVDYVNIYQVANHHEFIVKLTPSMTHDAVERMIGGIIGVEPARLRLMDHRGRQWTYPASRSHTSAAALEVVRGGVMRGSRSRSRSRTRTPRRASASGITPTVPFSFGPHSGSGSTDEQQSPPHRPPAEVRHSMPPEDRRWNEENLLLGPLPHELARPSALFPAGAVDLSPMRPPPSPTSLEAEIPAYVYSSASPTSPPAAQPRRSSRPIRTARGVVGQAFAAEGATIQHIVGDLERMIRPRLPLWWSPTKLQPGQKWWT